MAEPALDTPAEPTAATPFEGSARGEPTGQVADDSPAGTHSDSSGADHHAQPPDRAANPATADNPARTAVSAKELVERIPDRPAAAADGESLTLTAEQVTTPADTEEPDTPSAEPATDGPSAREADPSWTAPPTPRAPYASVHADNNHGTLIGQLFEAVQRYSGAPLPEAWVKRELADYLPVGNESDLADLLEKDRVLVLVADHMGSGRWTTALRLLTSASGDTLILRRIRRDSGEGFSMEGVKGHKHTGWILDLRDPAETLPAACDFGLELQHSDDLRADGSYLVVLTHTDLWGKVGYGVGHLSRSPQPPKPTDLFVHYLQSAGVGNPRDWADDHRISDALAHLRPGQVAGQARTLAQADAHYRAVTGRSTQLGSDGFDEVVRTVTQAVSGWMDALTTWHCQPGRTSYDRNFLLLAAVYDGAPIDNVHEKITSLGVALGEKKDAAARPTGQQGPGLIQLAHQIQADLQPDGTLRFAGPAYAEAVVRYFWRDRPELTEAFAQWTAQLCLGLKREPRAQLAQRMAPWILHHAQAARSTRLLRLIASDWAQDDILAEQAHDILVAATLDPQIGQLARNAIHRWASNDASSSRLLQTLAKVYGTLTPVSPETMLRRLGDLAHTAAKLAKQDVADAVGQAINGLWSNDTLRPQIRNTLRAWFASENMGHQRAASSAFMHLALKRDPSGAPALLTNETSAPEWVIQGWRTALESDQPDTLTHQASSLWLDAAVAQPDTAQKIIATLVRAVHDTAGDRMRGLRFLNLVRTAERWLVQTSPELQENCNRLHALLIERTQHADPSHRPDPPDPKPADE